MPCKYFGQDITSKKMLFLLLSFIFLFCHLLFLKGISPFDSLDRGLTKVRATASYSNEGLVEAIMLFLLFSSFVMLFSKGLNCGGVETYRPHYLTLF